MKTIIILAAVVTLTGCATHRPQARVIDATNKAPMFSRSVEKSNDNSYHKDGYDDETGKLEKHKEKTKSRKVSYDFTF